MAKEDENISVWEKFLEENLPFRYSGGLSGSWFTFLVGIMGDTTEQMVLDALLMNFLKHPNSTDDILPIVQDEKGTPKYAGETKESHRDRINNFWTTVKNYGQERGLIDLIEVAGFGTVSLATTLSGKDNETPSPKSGPAIPAYPSSNTYPSQFSVIIKLTEIKGTGDESDLVSDKQLATIRQFIKLAKPVDWVAREIVIVPGSLDVPYYDDGHDYGETDLEWLDTDTIAVGTVLGFMERHVAQLNVL